MTTLVGGPLDGERADIERGAPEWFIARVAPPEGLFMPPQQLSPCHSKVIRERYVRRTWKWPDGTRQDFYVHDSVQTWHPPGSPPLA